VIPETKFDSSELTLNVYQDKHHRPLVFNWPEANRRDVRRIRSLIETKNIETNRTDGNCVLI
jgi:hypothetical protein